MAPMHLCGVCGYVVLPSWCCDRILFVFCLQIPAFSSTHPFCEGCFSQLTGSARVWYTETIEQCENVDPCTLRAGMVTGIDASLSPNVAHGDIVECIFVALGQMKAYKFLESHNYFSSGWLKSLPTKGLGEAKVLPLGEVSFLSRSFTWLYSFNAYAALYQWLERSAVEPEGTWKRNSESARGPCDINSR